MFSSVHDIVFGAVVMSHDNRKEKYEKAVFIKHRQN
jgi:hypothetical protein